MMGRQLVTVAKRPNERARQRAIARDVFVGVPIAGATGVNGAGKTAVAVQSAIADMARGRIVYSTVPIVSPWGYSRPITSLRQLLELENCTVLADEVAAMFSSRSTQSLPAEFDLFLQILRHKNITLRWTAPGWMRVDNRIREVTQAVGNVMPMLRYSNGTPWPTPRIVAVGLLDCTGIKQDAMPERVLRRRLFRLKSLDSIGAYDTLADAPLFGHHAHSAVCVDCGGAVRRPAHSEERHQALGIPFYPELV